MADESADIVICDPPYNIGKDFGNDSDKQKMDEYLMWCDEWVAECIRILKPQGTLYIYGFSEILAFIRVRISINVRWIVWHYTNKVTPSLNNWQRTHESILCCTGSFEVNPGFLGAVFKQCSAGSARVRDIAARPGPGCRRYGGD